VKSRKAERMQKHHKRHKTGGLNLISLMDIFTILVFFLLVNSQDVETLPNAKDIQLPESYAEEKARENVVILVTDDAILVQGRPVGILVGADLREELIAVHFVV
jgi:biopolymer transport protein TolR